MQYHVTGTNHATGARMTLDIEALNKFDAEKKARSAGMDVQHAEPIRSDGSAEEHHGSRRRGEAPEPVTGMHPVLKTLLILAVVAVVGWFAWGWVR